jgi:hypothetical protein
MRSKTTLLLISAVSLIFILSVSCSSGPKRPQPGTPASFWQGAKEAFTAKDYMKTLENLDRAAKSEELASQALPWTLVIQAGLIRGYNDLADSFEKGARASRNSPGALRKQTSNYRRFARPLTLQMAEKFMAFQKSKDEQIPLAFPFPGGSPSEPPALGQVETGIMLPAAGLEDVQSKTITRAVILTASSAAGAGDDSSKAAELFKTEDLKVPRATFMTAMANALLNASGLFAPKKLDEPERAKLFAEMAKAALKDVPASLEVKALNERIDKILKATKSTT